MTHRNARLTPMIRAELVEQVLSGWPQAEVARLFRVSRATVAKWVRRFREGGPDALHDRSSRPLRSPRQTDQLQEAAICAARRMLAWGPHRIGWRLGIARSTVHAVLRRAGLHRLAWLHRTTREVVRYEHARPGTTPRLAQPPLAHLVTMATALGGYSAVPHVSAAQPGRIVIEPVGATCCANYSPNDLPNLHRPTAKCSPSGGDAVLVAHEPKPSPPLPTPSTPNLHPTHSEVLALWR